MIAQVEKGDHRKNACVIINTIFLIHPEEVAPGLTTGGFQLSKEKGIFDKIISGSSKCKKTTI